MILSVTNIQASELVGSLSSSESNYFLLLKKKERKKENQYELKDLNKLGGFQSISDQREAFQVISLGFMK